MRTHHSWRSGDSGSAGFLTAMTVADWLQHIVQPARQRAAWNRSASQHNAVYPQRSLPASPRGTSGSVVSHKPWPGVRMSPSAWSIVSVTVGLIPPLAGLSRACGSAANVSQTAGIVFRFPHRFSRACATSGSPVKLVASRLSSVSLLSPGHPALSLPR